jgi:hypothetical protein
MDGAVSYGDQYSIQQGDDNVAESPSPLGKRGQRFTLPEATVKPV